MLTERSNASGMIIISEIVDGYLVTRRFMGYTMREARRAFRAEFPRKAAS